jgi:hypothetical protein
MRFGVRRVILACVVAASALANYRREGRTEPLPLGVYGDVLVPGRVSVGDPVVPEVTVSVGQ